VAEVEELGEGCSGVLDGSPDGDSATGESGVSGAAGLSSEPVQPAARSRTAVAAAAPRRDARRACIPQR
jgi:hypothetical protein